jgi:hypothetical protein
MEWKEKEKLKRDEDEMRIGRIGGRCDIASKQSRHVMQVKLGRIYYILHLQDGVVGTHY